MNLNVKRSIFSQKLISHLLFDIKKVFFKFSYLSIYLSINLSRDKKPLNDKLAYISIYLSINLSRDNKPLDDKLADRMKISSKANQFTLMLMSCRPEDSGQYTCR